MRAGNKLAPWSEVVGTLYDNTANTMPDAAAMSSRRLLRRMRGEARNMMDLSDRKSRSSGRVSTPMMSLPPQMKTTCQPGRRSSSTRGFEVRVASASNFKARATSPGCLNRLAKQPKVSDLRLRDHCPEDQAASLAGHATLRRPIRRLGRRLSRSALAFSV